METIDFGKDAAPNPSGAPEAGGATSRGSVFGGESLLAMFLRAVARIARDVEAEAYRRLRDLEQRTERREGDPRPGAPNRVRHPDGAHAKSGHAETGDESRIH
jgi:hypothetical protein